jgi:D-amino peptidase
VRLNESSVGELGLNAALAGAFGVPVAVVSGDRAPAAEAQALPVDGTRAVVVKEAVSRHAARSVAPERARAMIRDAVREAVARSDPPRRPYTVTPPITVEIDFVITAHADHAAMAPAFRRSGPRTVSFRSDDYREPFRAFRTMFNLGGLE